MTIRILEENLKLAAETGENQVVVIFDMEGFNIRQYAWRPGKEMIAEHSINLVVTLFNNKVFIG